MDRQTETTKRLCERCGAFVPEGETCACERARRLAARRNRPRRFLLRPLAADTDGPAGLHPRVRELLRRRGVTEVRTFLEAPMQALGDEVLLDTDRVVARLVRAIRAGEAITLYGDYDADGVTSTALGVGVLRDLGARIDWYINDRTQEGFGICPAGVDAIAERGTRIILTADNGTTGREAVARAHERGMEVLITDHHEPNGPLPDCPVVNPKRADETVSFRELAGVGVLFKVMDALCAELGAGRRAHHELDLVALGTVADVVPLLGDNRILVKNGLKLMDPGVMRRVNRGLRPGLAALRRASGLSDAEAVRSYHLGYLFGPMINAEGRLDGVPRRAVELLLTRDQSRAQSLADELKEINDRRKRLVDTQYARTLELVQADKKILVVADPSFDEGVVGLLAGKLKKEFYLPAIVLGRDRAGRWKGSGRSIPGFNLKAALDRMAGLLAAYGGHEMACGLSVAHDQLDVVKNMLETAAAMTFPDEVEERLSIDAALARGEVDMKLVEGLETLEPFGQGFPRPRFLVRGLAPSALGYSRDGRHTRLKQGGVDYWAFGQRIEDPAQLNCVLGAPQKNVFRGRTSIQFRIEACAPDLEPEEA